MLIGLFVVTTVTCICTAARFLRRTSTGLGRGIRSRRTFTGIVRLLTAAFRSRFGLLERLDPYPAEDIETILSHAATRMQMELSEAAAARAGGYFADWVITELPSFFGTDTTDDVVIRTTLDQRLQKSAEEALKFIFQEKYSAKVWKG